MSSKTLDNLVYDIASQDEEFSKPFLKKDWLYIVDSNLTGNYSVNQIEFSTISLSSNGRYCNYQEAYLSLPFVFTIENVGTQKDWTSASIDQHFADCCLALKNSSTNIIHSISIDFGNGNVVQPSPYLNAYLAFKLHTEMSSEDERLNGSLLHYAKDSSTSWGFNDISGGEGRGLFNNVTAVGSIPTSAHARELVNDGLMKRQSYFQRSTESAGKDLVYGNDDVFRNKLTGNHIVNYSNAKVFYCDLMIRLRDLPFFNGDVPMMRGANMKLTLTLNNNVSFNFKKNADGAMSFSNFSNVSGLTNPFMVASNYHKYTQIDAAGGSVIAAPTGGAVSGSITTKSILGGSSALDNGVGSVDAEYVVKSGLAAVGQYAHTIRQCRLYVPAYSFSHSYESQYLSNSRRLISYNDLYFTTFDCKAQQQFNVNLTNGIAYAKRLILIGFMASTANGDVSPLSSPFTCEPSTTSPFLIQNFNAQVGGINMYQGQMLASYEQFLAEMNGMYGINGNQVTGLCSSRISSKDYYNNYHYIVVNLDRKLKEDEGVLQSISVSGQLNSTKDMTFYCYVEYGKKVLVDVSDGSRPTP